MQQRSPLFSFILLIVFSALFTSCTPSEKEKNYVATPTLHPDAIAPMTQITSLKATCTAAQETIEVLAIDATFASYTITPTETLTPTPTISPTPTLIPTITSTPPIDSEKIRKLLNKIIENDLGDAFDIGRTVTLVKQEGLSLIIEMSCAVDAQSYCTSTQALVDFVNACKQNEEIKNLIPEEIAFMQLWLFHVGEGDAPKAVFDVNWQDVQRYINGNISAEAFQESVRSTPIQP